jgi:hypothetical protein
LILSPTQWVMECCVPETSFHYPDVSVRLSRFTRGKKKEKIDGRCTLLTSWSRVLLEKLIVVQIVKQFLDFNITRRFKTVLTTARHLPLF